ncbi:hypothetical protein ACLOJK_012976 [Asimina triloba]
MQARHCVLIIDVLPEIGDSKAEGRAVVASWEAAAVAPPFAKAEKANSVDDDAG